MALPQSTRVRGVWCVLLILKCCAVSGFTLFSIYILHKKSLDLLICNLMYAKISALTLGLSGEQRLCSGSILVSSFFFFQINFVSGCAGLPTIACLMHETCRPLHESDLTMSFVNTLFCFPILSFIFFWLPFFCWTFFDSQFPK